MNHALRGEFTIAGWCRKVSRSPKESERGPKVGGIEQKNDDVGSMEIYPYSLLATSARSSSSSLDLVGQPVLKSQPLSS